MGLRHGIVRLACAAALLAPGDTVAVEEPVPSGLKESVKLGLVQLEVTVWPKEPDSDACFGLSKADFHLEVDHKPREIYAVDVLGAEEEGLPVEEPAAADSPERRGMTLVLLFDLWHLNLFYRDYACPPTKPLAFEEARRLVREQFRAGDRLLLVTSSGWPVVHYDWLRDADTALRALDRLERNRQVMALRQEHFHHEGWIAGMESLFLALGRYPGRKDVIYLADDFRFDDVALRMYEIAGRAQASGVVVSAVDLLASCRGLPGPGAGIACSVSGGLACTDFRKPVALNPLSRDTGGLLFHNESIATAVEQLRSMRRCRYLVSFREGQRRPKRDPVVTLRLKEGRKDLTLLAPSSFQTQAKAPSPRERDEALFLLPHFGRGIAAEAALWPYHPHAKRGRWKAMVVARLERTDDEPWPEELSEIAVRVLVHKQSSVYGELGHKIVGDELLALRGVGQERLLLFPVDEIPAGDLTVDLTVSGNADGVSANVRKSLLVPRPPAAGQAGPWVLSDRWARVGDTVIRAPSLDDVLTAGEPASMMAYGCRPKPGAAPAYAGRLVPLAGGAPVALPVQWLDAAEPTPGGCGWLVGEISFPLEPGLWVFEPPPTLGGDERPAPVEFGVRSSTPSAEPSAEADLGALQGR